MHDVIFYEDGRGNEPTAEFISELREKSHTDKNARVNFNKIVAYIDILCEKGTRVGEPVVKHLDGDIWELRPTSDRVFFFNWQKGKLVLLHHFVKKTNKTPPREIEQAKRNQKDFLARSDSDGK